jgi:hypothetical protein
LRPILRPLAATNCNFSLGRRLLNRSTRCVSPISARSACPLKFRRQVDRLFGGPIELVRMRPGRRALDFDMPTLMQKPMPEFQSIGLLLL